MTYEHSKKKRTHFGALIEEYLKEARLGRRELASLIPYSAGLIGRYIRGDHEPPGDFVDDFVSVMVIPEDDERNLREAAITERALDLIPEGFEVVLRVKNEAIE